MFKLINPDNAKRHDYSGRVKPHITHMIFEELSTKPLYFKQLESHQFVGTIRTCEFVNRGDFIYKSMESRRIGVYEISEIFGSRVSSELCEPFRDHKCAFSFCGYLSEDGNNIEIFNGYGVI